MNIRRALPVALTVVVAAGGLAPALAAPAKSKPKPITESYVAEGLPVPLPLVGVDEVDGTNSCTNPDFEGLSTTTKTIKTVGAGTLQVDLSGFAGDWDITVTDANGTVLGEGAGTTTGGEAPAPLGNGQGSIGTDNKETLTLKTKKGLTLNIGVCNFLGGETANAKYTFTYK